MAIESQIVEKGTAFAPIKTSFTNQNREIVGWNEYENRAVEDSFPQYQSNPDTITQGFTSNKDLYACWGYNISVCHSEHATVGVDPNNNQNEQIKKFHPGEYAKFTCTTDNGYSIGKWYYQSQTETSEKTGGEYSLTVSECAKLSVSTITETYRISYTMDGGKNDSSNPESYTVETPTITLKDPSKTDYTFKKWSPTNTIPQGSTGTSSFTALWTPVQYTITYILDGGTNSIYNPSTYNIESNTITLYDPTKDRYDFVNWTDAAGNVVTQITNGSTGNRKLYANWEQEPQNYTIAEEEEIGTDSYLTKTYNLISDNGTISCIVKQLGYNSNSKIIYNGNDYNGGKGVGSYTVILDAEPMVYQIKFHCEVGGGSPSYWGLSIYQQCIV